MILIVLFVFGLALGSFVNALVWRLRRQQKAKSKKQKEKYSIVNGRSICTHCGHKLAWFDLIPVLSWISLRGKCRYCGKSISWQYPVVEVATAALFIISYLSWPSSSITSHFSLLFVLWLVFLTGFVALTVYDLKWMELPNKVIYTLTGLALLQTLFLVATDGLGEFSSAVWGFVVVGGLFYALFQLSAGKWIGGGDVKLGFLIGILVGGPMAGLAVIFLSSLLGTIVSLPLLASKSLKATSRIPFGPFLIAATVVVYLYGDRLADFYRNILI